MDASAPYTALLFDPDTGNWRAYRAPLSVVVARRGDEVLPALRSIERAVERQGLHAAGFVSYEAAPAFDPALSVAAADDFPLLWFGLFEGFESLQLPAPPPVELPRWTPGIDGTAFRSKVATIKQAIARGETYQVNFTFPLSAPFRDDPWPFFLQLVRGQRAGAAAWVDTGRFALCSASPELFFELADDRLLSRPMKGTAPRGLTPEEDARQLEALRRSEKDRAENVMILDMIRNDLGRLPGGPVRVAEAFAVEQYPTVWQMTSTAVTTTAAPVSEIFRALFPCASITGAPKVRTMRIIRALEERPRRIYTGAIGHISPGRQARFSVAIRTALVDRETQTAEYGVGAGITWSSEPATEYRECLLKARILRNPMPTFELLETLLWRPGAGYALLEEHLRRLAASAGYFDFPYAAETIRTMLAQQAAALPPAPHKVRLLLDAAGGVRCEASPVELPETAPPLRVALAAEPVDSRDPFLYHKTTHRRVYEQARAARPEVDEVLLWNERGELTEACHYNLVLEKDGRRLTPPVDSGLLAGTLRARLLEDGEIHAVALTREDLLHCERLWLINSVRGWREAVLVHD